MANRLREIREATGLTQDELARRVGTTFQQISRLERELRSLNDRWMSLLAPALGVRKADLLVEDTAGPLPRARECAQDAGELRILRAYRSLGAADRASFARLMQSIAMRAQRNDVREVG